MTFTTASPDRITLIDVKGETIHLVKTLVKPLAPKLVETWNFVKSNSDETITGKICRVLNR